MYDPEILPRDKMSIEEYRSSNGTTINHFYEKLLKLENTMNTESAKEIAKVRTEFLNEYLDRFIDEWNGEKWFSPFFAFFWKNVIIKRLH